VSYEHDLVERAVQVLAPQEPSFESLLRRRDRKRRNQRLAAGAVGLALGIAVMALASTFLRSAADRETGEWPPPTVTSTRLVRSGEVLEDPYPRDNPTYVVAVDVATGARRTVAGCKGTCRLLTPFDASADGGWIAYHLANCEEGECGPSDPEGGLWVVGADGSPRFVAPGFLDAPWSWSPTGAQLAYADVDELILLDPTTWEHTRIAIAPAAIRTIAWGPDGRSIAYSVEPPSTGASDPGAFGVMVLRSGGEPRSVSFAAGVEGIAWSPDGSSLLLDRVISDRSVIEIVPTDGSSGARVLVEGPMSEGPGAPVWSPDGSRIAFIRTPRGGPGVGLEYWVIGRDGRNEVLLSDGTVGPYAGDGGSPVWSPDSKLVAWSAAAESRWLVTDANGGGASQQVDRLEVERWRQG
jgi:dipeptidyl aminopeptidase/acylaminoacyl peptidase